MTPSDEIHYDPVADRVLDMEREMAQRRKTGRVEIEQVNCNLGRILDLSAGGLRMIGPKLPGDGLIPLHLMLDEIRLDLVGRIAWSRPVSRKEAEMGIEFLEVTAEQRARLTQYATANRFRRVM